MEDLARALLHGDHRPRPLVPELHHGVTSGVTTPTGLPVAAHGTIAGAY